MKLELDVSLEFLRDKPDSALLTRPQFARLIGVHITTVYRWAKKGTAPRAIRLGDQLYYSVGAIREWVRERSPDDVPELEQEAA